MCLLPRLSQHLSSRREPRGAAAVAAAAAAAREREGEKGKAASFFSSE